ncbi:MAG: FMN-binding protein [Actinobacteria bacterium]|nr:FMN-binding protein [Actinomycetota bacterium]
MGKEKNSSGKSVREKILNNRIYPLIFLVLVVLVSVSLMMVIGNMTEAKIVAEREAEIISQLKGIFSDMQDYKTAEGYYEIYRNEDVIGFAFTATGKGYGGDISILIGIDSNYQIKGISILSNTETPGLGTRITEISFTDQFKGLGLEDIRLAKDGGKIDAITGATISSRAVTDAVRDEIEIKIETIKKNK